MKAFVPRMLYRFSGLAFIQLLTQVDFPLPGKPIIMITSQSSFLAGATGPLTRPSSGPNKPMKRKPGKIEIF
jgi:hypothetical protein